MANLPLDSCTVGVKVAGGGLAIGGSQERNRLLFRHCRARAGDLVLVKRGD